MTESSINKSQSLRKYANFSPNIPTSDSVAKEFVFLEFLFWFRYFSGFVYLFV